MDKETKDFLENMIHQINSRFEGVESELKNFHSKFEDVESELKDFKKEAINRFDKLEQGQSKLEQGQSKLEKGQYRLEQGQKEIRDLIEELDPKNANRHRELQQSIDELKNDLSTVEIVTASNYADIAKLKKIK